MHLAAVFCHTGVGGSLQFSGFKTIYFFYFWGHWALCCCTWAYQLQQVGVPLSGCMAVYLVASLIAEQGCRRPGSVTPALRPYSVDSEATGHRLSCPAACGTFGARDWLSPGPAGRFTPVEHGKSPSPFIGGLVTAFFTPLRPFSTFPNCLWPSEVDNECGCAITRLKPAAS